MPRRSVENVSIRISVDGGGKAVAEITEFGQKGEKSVRKMEVASKDASKGLGGLVERAKNLKLAAVALTGVLAAGGLAGALYAMTRRAIESADAIGKTADKLGIGTDALQEYRFAAEQAGVSQETFDMAMQRFTRRAAEAAQGTGEAKDALKQMGIELLDQNGNMRASEDLLLDVADAFESTTDSSERLRLAFKLFDSEGVALVNMLMDGSDALEEMREEARRLGIVIDESLIREAEEAQDKLDAVNKVISAQLTKAFLSLAPLISDAAMEFAGFAQDVGVAYEKMKLFFSGDFDFSGLSESTIESQFRRYKMQVEELQAALAQIGDPNGFWEWNEWATLRTQLDQAYGSYETYAQRYLNLQKQIIAGTDEATAEQIQSAQELESAFEKTIQGQGVANNLRDGFSAYKELEDQIRQTTEEVKKIEEEARAQRVEGNKIDALEYEKRSAQIKSIEEKLQNDLVNLQLEGVDKILAEREKSNEKIRALAFETGENQREIQNLLLLNEEIYARKVQEFQEKEDERNRKASETRQAQLERERLAQEQVFAINQSVIESLNLELDALFKTDEQLFIDEALRRLSAEATAIQRQEVEKLARELFREKDALEERNELEEEARAITEKYTDEIEKLNEEKERLLELYEKELITFETYKKGLEEINGKIQDVEEAQEEANKTFAGAAKAGLQRYIDEAADLYDVLEVLTYQSMKTLEDILVNTALTGKFEWKDMVNSMIADLTRLIIQATITRPLAQGLMGLFGDGAAFSGGQVTAFAKGGIVGGPTIFPMANGMGLMGEEGPEAVMPLARTGSGKLGVYVAGDAGGSRNLYTVNVDARGSSDPGATSAAVERAVDAALNARIPGIVQASADLARRQVVDNYQRRGNRFE